MHRAHGCGYLRRGSAAEVTQEISSSSPLRTQVILCAKGIRFKASPKFASSRKATEAINIVRAGTIFYGIRQADGAFSVERFASGGYTGVQGGSLDTTLRAIDEELRWK
jgi:hypothetical protein